MGVLVIDPHKDARQTAYDLVKWVDRRHSVELAEDGASAWKTALDWRPDLILCEPTLPDVSGEKLCRQLRTRLARTTFVAYTNDGRVLDQSQRVFDGILRKPPSRFALLSYLHTAKRNRRMAELQKPQIDAAELRPQPLKAGDLFRPVQIIVAMADEPELKFRLPVPEGSTIGAVFRQLGKKNVTWFALLRGGAEIDATLYTPITQDDLLLIRV